jgi:hypothetical protein
VPADSVFARFLTDEYADCPAKCCRKASHGPSSLSGSGFSVFADDLDFALPFLAGSVIPTDALSGSFDSALGAAPEDPTEWWKNAPRRATANVDPTMLLRRTPMFQTQNHFMLDALTKLQLHELLVEIT